MPSVGETSSGRWAPTLVSGPDDPLRSIFAKARYQGTENFLQPDALTVLNEMSVSTSRRGRGREHARGRGKSRVDG